MTTQHLIKVNGQIVELISTPRSSNWEAKYENGFPAHINPSKGKFLTRGRKGKIQSHGIVEFCIVAQPVTRRN